MSSDAPLFPPGTVVSERYRLERLLGRGGMASVYRATDLEHDVEVAMKLLHPDAARHPGFRSRFLTEARTMGRLEHDNIAKVWEYGVDADKLYFVMELAAGGTLLDRIKKAGKTQPLEACLVIFDVLKGLQAAHKAGVVHRDVKPSNVLLTEYGAKIADFGIARLMREAVPHRTMTGDNLGTMGYMAPEQVKDPRSVRPASDVYSVGATLFALIARRNPAGLAQAARHPQVLDPIPQELRPVLLKACAYTLDERYPSARHMAADLAQARDAIAASLGIPPEAELWMRNFDTALANSGRVALEGDTILRSTNRSLHGSGEEPTEDLPGLPFEESHSLLSQNTTHGAGPAAWSLALLGISVVFFLSAVLVAAWIVVYAA